MSVILALSDYAFYNGLRHPNLVFNQDNINGLIFVGEVLPDKMYGLLTTRWGMGHNLAIAFIDHYGGHIYDIYRNLRELAKKGEMYTAISATQTNSVRMCLAHDGDKKRMRELLTQIAEKGFAPVSHFNDPEAAVIGQHNVGGLVHSNEVIGLPHHVRRENSQGLVPYKQSIRLVIAKVLHMNPVSIADMASASAESTSAVNDLKIHGAIDEKLIELKARIEEVEFDVKACSDHDERMISMKKEELLRDEELQL